MNTLLTIQQRQYQQPEDVTMSLTNDTIKETESLESAKFFEVQSMTMRLPITDWDDGNTEATQSLKSKNEKVFDSPTQQSYSRNNDVATNSNRTTGLNNGRDSFNSLTSTSQTLQGAVVIAADSKTRPSSSSEARERKTIASSDQPLFKCACSWKNCRQYQKAFRQIQHEVFDGVIKIKITEGHPESMAYQQCIHRTLGITHEPDWKMPTTTASQQYQNSSATRLSSIRFCKYTIAKHHFTEQHIRKYETKNKIFSFLKPFSYHGAKKYLYKVDPREIYIPPEMLSSNVDPESALYLQCPNVPSDVVKGTYHKIAEIIRQRQKLQLKAVLGTEHPTQQLSNLSSNLDENDIAQQNNRMTQAQHHMEQILESSELDARQSRAEMSHESISNKSGAPAQSTAVTSKTKRGNEGKLSSEYNQDKEIDESQIDYKSLWIEKEAENKKLKGTLENLKSQLEYLQSMVETLQLQQFQTLQSQQLSSSRHSRGSRYSHMSTTSKRNRHRKNQQATRSVDSLRSGGRSEDDDGIDYDEEIDQMTALSRNHDDVSELQTLATGASFVSKYTQRKVGDNMKLYHDPESESDDDDYSYADCISLGTSTIISASMSVKSLPREQELNEHDGDQTTDDDMTFAKLRGYRGNSIVSVGSNSAQSLTATVTSKYSRSSSLTFPQQRPPTHKNTNQSKGSTTNKGYKRQATRFAQGSVGSIESKPTSSAYSIGNTIDNSVEGAATFVTSPKSATITTASSSAVSSTDQQSVFTEILQVSADASVSVSEMFVEKIEKVTNIRLTDPYGEQGNYSGQICRATGMPNGYGRLEYDKAGRWYEGEWKLGRWTGKGKLSNHNGDYYEGDVENDMKHGIGFMHFADGRTYGGEYVNGEMVNGKMTYEDGSTYEGQWKNGLRHGRGHCIFLDESSYQGEFKDGEFWGRGKMIWNDGGWYEGNWLNGEMHGMGIEVRPDGRIRHDGQWFRGQPIRRQN